MLDDEWLMNHITIDANSDARSITITIDDMNGRTYTWITEEVDNGGINP